MATETDLLRDLIGVGNNVSDATLETYLTTSAELVAMYARDVPDDDPIPSPVRLRAERAVAAELYNQDQAPNGFLNQSAEFSEVAPVRIGTDPLRPARALLGLWVDPVTFA